jgi:cystathionine beta-lyase/cystathionine gamma-synthase
MSGSANLQPSHIVRSGHPPESLTTPSSPAICQSAAFDIPDLDALQALFERDASGHIYTRDSNPNHAALSSAIASMEAAESATVFASGMSAVSSVFLTLAAAGDHVILSRSLYGMTLQLAARLCRQYGLSTTLVDVSDAGQFREAVTERTRFALIETVSNPLLEVADIAAIAAELQTVPLVADSTFTTPELVRPCQLGAAVVVHSASKYLNGHGDVMLGAAAGSHEMMRRLNETCSLFGQNANPFEAWLCQRGLRTLPLRMRQICETTNRLASCLSQHPAVRRVWHPSLAEHPSYQIAKRLYPGGTGGILSMELNGAGRDVVNRFIKSSAGIPFSPTLADARTTVSWPAGTSHRFLSAEERSAAGIPENLIRLSVGLEPFEMLASELQVSLSSLVE